MSSINVIEIRWYFFLFSIRKPQLPYENAYECAQALMIIGNRVLCFSAQIPTDWSKTFLCTFEAYFLTKVHENRMRDYWSEITSDDIFHFSVSVIELEFRPIGFLTCHLFRHFYPKIDANANFNSVFSNIGVFNRKR